MNLNLTNTIILAAFFLLTGCNPELQENKSKDPIDHPNIVLILADDLGYGDVSAFNSGSRIETPNLDGLAASGMSFSDTHSNSSVCTPTRYGLLTGEYAWRSNLKRGVLLGYSPSLIGSNQPTIASMLKKQGYYTACIGKWHLGLDWKLIDSTYLQFPPDQPITQDMIAYHDLDKIDFAAQAGGGPLTAGFDYSFIIPASLDFEPYCYLENNLLLEPLDSHTEGSDLNTGYTEAFWRPGKMSSSFEHEQVLPTFIDQGTAFIQSREGQSQPFFLYLPLNAPHTPWLPTQVFDGSTEVGTYGDFVKMVDDAIGNILQQLIKSGFDQNTVVIFTSDNGAYWKDEFIERYQHRSNFNFRGMKADIYEGGHRVPLVVRWPGKVAANSWSESTICLTDIFATIQDLVQDHTSRPTDSFSFLNQLTGVTPSTRPPVIHHSSRGMFAIRSGDWKLIEGLGSGGFTEPAVVSHQPGMPQGQLYHLGEDQDESNNLYQQQSQVVDSLMAALTKIRDH